MWYIYSLNFTRDRDIWEIEYLQLVKDMADYTIQSHNIPTVHINIDKFTYKFTNKIEIKNKYKEEYFNFQIRKKNRKKLKLDNKQIDF